MNRRWKFFKQSNLIEGVEEDSAVERNIEAYRYLRQEGEITHKTMKKVHEIIMKDRQPEIAGKYKDKENFVVVGREKKIFTKPEKVEMKLDKLLDIEISSPIDALRWKLTWVNIHPFADGNGRVSRLLYRYLVKEELGEEPIIFRADDRKGYYSLCNSVENIYVDPGIRYEPINF